MSKVTVIVPAYNEEGVIKDCLKSLLNQSQKIEIIVVDDGSTDQTVKQVLEFPAVRLFKQQHLGPGLARNLGAKQARGKILVLVDADMTFSKNFIKELVEPIVAGQVIGTFSKNEFVSNQDNIWSRCWNINKGLPEDRMHPSDYPDQQPIFRAILKKEFERVGGFEPIGYIDDYTLSEKLGAQAKAVKGAIFYHRNPATLAEVFRQARWVGKSEYKRRKIKSELLMRLIALIRYSPPLTLINGLKNALLFQTPQFIIFKIVYDWAVEISLIKSFWGEQANK